MGFLDTLTDDIRAGIAHFTGPPRPTLGALPDAPSQPVKDPHFFFGQPVTTGPYPMVVGTPQTIQDPNVGTAKASRYVQIQNATGCTLKVQTGVGDFTIQGLAASTIPTDNQLPVVLNPVSGYTNFSEYVTIIWLLDGQSSPMSDGSINAPYVPGTPIVNPPVVVSFTSPSGGPIQILPAPSVGTSYQLYSIVFNYAGPPTVQLLVSVENVTTSQTLFNTPYFDVGYPDTGPSQTYSLTGIPQQTGEIGITWLSSITESVDVTLNYFLVTTS
jgi:hypothetical protein